MFQSEMTKRTVCGKLCEVAGEKALPLDLFWRKFHFEKRSTVWFEKLKSKSPTNAARFNAYADGYNDYISSMTYGDLPLEFHLLD